MSNIPAARLAALEAVVEAAREFADKIDKPLADHEWTQLKRRFYDTLAALDAHTEAPQETVTLAVWEGDEGDMRFVRASSHADRWPPPWRRLGTVTLPLDLEGGR